MEALRWVTRSVCECVDSQTWYGGNPFSNALPSRFSTTHTSLVAHTGTRMLYPHMINSRTLYWRPLGWRGRIQQFWRLHRKLVQTQWKMQRHILSLEIWDYLQWYSWKSGIRVGGKEPEEIWKCIHWSVLSTPVCFHPGHATQHRSWLLSCTK